MTDSRLERVLRRDRAVLLTALAGLAIVAWAYIVWMWATAPMDGMNRDGGMQSVAPGLAPWSVADFLAMLAMWAVMMIGMMTPSAAPMILIYARVGRKAEGGGTPFAPAGWFASGYLLAWAGFALAATLLQWLLEKALLVSPATASAGPRLGGLLLIAAGLYQWTPLKDACLAQCQSPFQFIQRHGGFRGDRAGALALGLRHGAYCIGCCWALMLMLFGVGVMNLLWIAAIAGLVLAEKVVPAGRLVSRGMGAAMLMAGIALATEMI
jgi:predicted metal-binding membrane protein